MVGPRFDLTRGGKMAITVMVLSGIIAALHGWFLILEMFLWQRPLGLKTFRQTPEAAATSASLAANQGLYNGFLSGGLIASFFLAEPASGLTLRVFCLICVTAAGLFGAVTVSKRIFWIQAMPAILALAILSYLHW